MVPLMCAEEKLKAVQLWNILSEKLQEIVNNSAADINALHTNSFQEPSTSTQPNYYYYPQEKASQDEDPSNAFVPTEELGQLSKSPIPETMEGFNSLGSFSDIQCPDEEDMDGVEREFPVSDMGGEVMRALRDIQSIMATRDDVKDVKLEFSDLEGKN